MDFARIHNQLRFYEAMAVLYDIDTIMSVLSEKLRHFAMFGGDAIEHHRNIREAKGIVTTEDSAELQLEHIEDYNRLLRSLVEDFEAMTKGIDYSDISPIDLSLFNHSMKRVDNATIDVEAAFSKKGARIGVDYAARTNAECVSYFDSLRLLRMDLIDAEDYITITIPRASVYESAV